MIDDFKPVIELLKKIKIKAKNISLYEIALTHSSFAYENEVESNERLEFLGDAVLEIFMSEYLYKNQKEMAEGIMTKKRAQLVCEEALFKYSNKINLVEYLRLGRGENIKGASQATIADAFEALMGAIYLDLGYKDAKKAFYRLVIPNIDLTSDIKDFKTILQEYVQGDRKTINYKIINESGPSHDKLFEAAVYLDGNIILGQGVGKTKKRSRTKGGRRSIKEREFLC